MCGGSQSVLFLAALRSFSFRGYISYLLSAPVVRRFHFLFLSFKISSSYRGFLRSAPWLLLRCLCQFTSRCCCCAGSAHPLRPIIHYRGWLIAAYRSSLLAPDLPQGPQPAVPIVTIDTETTTSKFYPEAPVWSSLHYPAVSSFSKANWLLGTAG
jgi:hypothetical protein